MLTKRSHLFAFLGAALLIAGTAFGQTTLLADYEFNESSGSTLYDSGPNGYTATTNSTTRVAGHSGNALSLDGSSQYGQLSQNLYRDGMVITAWVKPPYYSYMPFFQSIVEIAGSDIPKRAGILIDTNDGGRMLAYHHGHFRVWPNVTNVFYSTWMSVAAVFTPTTIDLYINNELVEDGSRLFQTIPVDSDPVKTSQTYIGRNVIEAQLSRPFFLKGAVDELKIYSLNTIDPGAEAAWVLTGPVGANARDTSGITPANLTLSQYGATWVNDPVQPPYYPSHYPTNFTTYLNLNGTNGQASLTSRNLYGNNMTISAMVKPTSALTGFASVIEISGNSATKRAAIVLGGGNHSVWYVHHDVAVEKANVWEHGVWINLTVVLTPYNLTLYANGVKIDQQSTWSDANNATELNTVRVGKDVVGGNFWFPGDIQKLQLFDYAQTAEEVAGYVEHG